MLGPKQVDIPCVTGSGRDGDEKPSDYQYASKILCGRVENDLAMQGSYRASVNVHNPNYETVEFRYKFALANPAEDGKISYFIDTKIGADGAQYFTCEFISKFTGFTEPFDGFFVVESREPLDVVTYYTGGPERDVATLDIEPTRERPIADNRKWSCGNQRAVLERASSWTLNGSPAVQVSSATVNGQQTPIGNFYGNQDRMNIWLSDVASINSNQQPGAYNYRLAFCLCGEGNEYPTGAVINVAGLRADNSVTANVDGGSPFITGPNSHNDPAGTGTTTVTGLGDHYLEFAANNQGSYHAVGFSGTINIQNRYLGACRAD
ncbi:MAG: hypothetical protein ACRCSU_07180 [Paracoccaceae bacterium]